MDTKDSSGFRHVSGASVKPIMGLRRLSHPGHSMYGIFTYIGVVWGVNVGIYGIHRVSGHYCSFVLERPC